MVVDHAHVPGKAFEISDAATRLVHMVGGGFFNEPRYYDPRRSLAAFYRELITTGRIASAITDAQGLTAQARQVLETAAEVARGDSPEDLLIIAAWARDPRGGLRLRRTPEMLFTIAAAHPATRRYLPFYARAILRRPDEIRGAFGAFRRLFQIDAAGTKSRGSLPHALRKALALALAECTDYELLKYESRERPRLADVLLMVGGSKKLGRFLARATGQKRDRWPVSKAMFEYLVNGAYVEPLSPTLAVRSAVLATKSLDGMSSRIFEDAGLTWENVVSHFGSTREVWELCIPLMGEMALTRNLRNFEKVEISDEAWARVREKLLGVEASVQLPFRFFSAARAVSTAKARSIVEAMLDLATSRVRELPGVTMAITDNSGSAVGCAVSGKSGLRVADAGNTLAAVIAKRLGKRALIGVFGDCFMWVPFGADLSCLSIKERIDMVAQTGDRRQFHALAIPQFQTGSGAGASTETGLWFALDDITQRRVHVDRILLLSDLCCYTQGDNGTAKNCGVNLEDYFGKGAHMQAMVDRYRQAVNPNCRVYSINLGGYTQSQMDPKDGRTHLMSGWSEKVFDLISQLEAGPRAEQSEPGKVEVPALAVLREKYRM